MNNTKITTRIFFACANCLFIVSVPIIGILAMWQFNLPSLEQEIVSFFAPLAEAEEKDEETYNFEVEKEDNKNKEEVLTEKIKAEVSKVQTPEATRDNRAVFLEIQSADIAGKIVYGNDGDTLLTQGFWNYPFTAIPGQLGQSVIFGHRRHHLPPLKDTFYNLDKVEVGDRIEIKLKDGTWLEYTVTKTEVRNPEYLDSMVFQDSKDSIIKLVTCTPLGTDKQRLIITAKKAF